jgi:hypothetical protein
VLLDATVKEVKQQSEADASTVLLPLQLCFLSDLPVRSLALASTVENALAARAAAQRDALTTFLA